jgi:hypothetical protein
VATQPGTRLHTESSIEVATQLGTQLSTESTTELVDSRPIWPGRPELIYQRYLAAKGAWLTEHLAVRPSGYRKARGFKSHSVKYCAQQARHLPKQRLNLETGTLIQGRPHWTTEEI